MIKRLRNIKLPEVIFPLFMLFVSFFAYGILIPWLGFYSDDWFQAWAYQKLGIKGIVDLFNLSRPLFRFIPSLTIQTFGFVPWHYHLFAFLMRWLSGILFFLFMKSLFPSQKIMAYAGAVLLVLYPGFTVQSLALTFGDILVVLNVFLISLYLTVLAIRSPQKRALFSILALICASINLLFLDYFFMLELMRPIIIWIALKNRDGEKKSNFGLWCRWYVPYLFIFCGSAIYRAFFLPQQTFLHKVMIFDLLRDNPGNAMLLIAKNWLYYIYMNTLYAWSAIFRFPSVNLIGKTSFFFWIGLVILVFIVSLILNFFKSTQKEIRQNQKRSSLQAAGWLIAISFVFVGVPYLITGLQSSLSDYSSRFNISFMLGSCLLIGLLLEFLPFKQIWKVVLLSILIAFSTGWLFINATAFRLDWKEQKKFYWTLTWRIPEIKPGTLLLSNDIPELNKNNASSLASAIDYIYSQTHPSAELTFLYTFASEHVNLLTEKDPIIPQWPLYKFKVDKRQVVFIYYDADCPQVLLPEYPFEYKGFDPRIEPLITLSSTTGIINAEKGIKPQVALFGTEPDHDWCYYFSKADLARQESDWDTVIAMEEEALNLFGFPEKNPRQLFLLIEGLALEGDWEKVQELFLQAYQHEFAIVASQSDETARMQDTADLKQAYLTFWEYLDVHSHETQAKPAARSAILSALESEN